MIVISDWVGTSVNLMCFDGNLILASGWGFAPGVWLCVSDIGFDPPVNFIRFTGGEIGIILFFVFDFDLIINKNDKNSEKIPNPLMRAKLVSKFFRCSFNLHTVLNTAFDFGGFDA